MLPFTPASKTAQKLGAKSSNMNISVLFFWLLSHPLPKQGCKILSELFLNGELYFSALHKGRVFLCKCSNAH